MEVEEDEESIIMTTGSASTSMTTVNKKDDDDRPEPEACRYCKHKGEMLVEFQNSFLGYLIAVLLFLLLGLVAILVAPVGVMLTRSKVQRCPRCLNKVKESTLQSLSSGRMSDEVWAFNVGSFGVILTRKYLIYILLVLVTLGGILALLQSGVLQYDESQPISNIEWPAYVQDCGREAVALDRRKASAEYYHKYHQKAVSWRGYLQRVEYKSNYVWSHTCSLVLEMEGDAEREFKHQPSLMLSLSGYYFAKYRDLLAGLERGDALRFNATIMAMGNEHYTHHLHGFYLEELGQRKASVETHVHGVAGRYAYEED